MMKRRPDPKRFEIPQRKTYKLGPMQKALALVGNPEKSVRTILVAGTNGKGSTARFIASLFSAHGLRTGLYTSPHVLSRTERIAIDGKPILEISLKALEEKFKEVL